MEPDQVLLRLETLRSKQASHVLATPEEVLSYAQIKDGSGLPKFCVHEVLGSRVKLFFDLDNKDVNSPIDIEAFD